MFYNFYQNFGCPAHSFERLCELLVGLKCTHYPATPHSSRYLVLNFGNIDNLDAITT